MGMKASSTIDRNAAEQIAQILAQILADTYITLVKTQNFHWNLIDPRFYSLHKVFEDQYDQLAEAADELAERIRQLKLPAPGSMKQFLQLGTFEEAESDLSGDDMIHALCHDREALSKNIRPKIEEVIKMGDEGTGDLLIQHLRMHDKAAWMLRSNLIDYTV
jgi:DNA-binding ferritin-like protein (oxidative damage protectant)